MSCTYIWNHILERAGIKSPSLEGSQRQVWQIIGYGIGMTGYNVSGVLGDDIER